ncbi:MAG: polysaccharide export protein [Thalassotalea sp.]|nr:polysaccharide export protein [Thalassotalea sp.]MDG2394542.1 polysaccharide export protein [Thalassotalea sp.]
MYKTITFLILLLLSLKAIANETYRVEPGDTIKIQVFGEDDLTKQLMLENSGEVTYPFLGILPIQGLTVYEIEQLIFNGLKGDYLIYPHVSVEVVKYRPFYVRGDVQGEGTYPYKPGLTVGQAMVLAGGSMNPVQKIEFYIQSYNSSGRDFKLVEFSRKLNAGDILLVEQNTDLVHTKTHKRISEE